MNKQQTVPDIRNLDRLACWLDSKFRIPGTSIRFGFDALIGLVPGIGDMTSFLISCYILSEARSKGASGYVMARMMLNTGIDLVVGSVPFLGDIFDVGFKANQRNLRLLQDHFKKGRHRGSASKVIIPVVVVMLAFFAALVWGIYKLIVWIF